MAKFVETLVKQVLRMAPTKKGEATFTKGAAGNLFVQNTWYNILAQGTKPSTFYAKWADAQKPYADMRVALDLSALAAGHVFEIEILRAVDGSNYRRHSLTTLNGTQIVGDLELAARCTADTPIQVRWRQTDATGSVEIKGTYHVIGGTES